MGMAASQARFLGLTARKSNTEYQGQQVNQQRTALANQSAGLFNQMLALEVPTPPSATNYYSIRYTYTDDGSNYEILSQTPDSDGKYTVKTKVTYDAEVASKFLLSGTYKEIEEGKSYTYNGYTLTKVTDDALMEEIGAASNVFYKYTTDKADTYYIKESTFEEVLEQMKESGEYYGTTEQYLKGTGKKTRYEEITGATFDSDTSGRLIRIHYTKDVEDTSSASGSTVSKPVEVSKDLTMTEVQDSTGYDQAMEEYYYKKSVYDKTIEDINAKTAMLQQQDRTLELKLKQLDTEEKALNAELEAVKKVIENNVTSTFKTFA